MAAEADEFELTVVVTFRFPAFNDREALRRRAHIFTSLEKIIPFARRKMNIVMKYEIGEGERTGRRIPYS